MVLIGIPLMTNEMEHFSWFTSHLCVCAFHLYKMGIVLSFILFLMFLP